ncbi:MAG: PD-(D/E)XK nuclease family protein, partial [Bacteroidia bacterium]|nr:PD-(D/E)XK nuclease family protein [Bacteroidia bacterium]
IFKYYYDQGKADILWDADEYYLNQPQQEAGMFLRNNLKIFSASNFQFIEKNFKEAKNIQLVSVPKQIGQAQVVKQTLQSLIDQQIPLDRVAVVLANEKLLWPVLQQLPESVEHVNITMEYPLRYTSTYAFIEQLIQLQIAFAKQKSSSKTIYHHDLVALLRQPLFVNYLLAKKIHLNTDKVISQIKARNLSFISRTVLAQLFEKFYDVLSPLFVQASSIGDFSTLLINILKDLISHFSQQQQTQQNSLELEYLHIVLKNSNRLHDILARYPHFNDIHSFRQLFSQVVGSSTAPFIGEPLRGLQIMGVLETRTLDFEHIILVNVNEGVLPSGKSINSFIPNDLKRAFGLPLYLEKDAIYAYHFYRLLQKATDITITYDSETDTFGKGEKSRFITQLQLEMPNYNPEIKINERVANYKDFPEEKDKNIVVNKDQNVLSAIFEKAVSNDIYGGFSPSGLLAYKECPLKFYFRYGTRLKEPEEVEESAEANTFGSILHLSLETFYKPFISKTLSDEGLRSQANNIDQIVNESFVSFFDNNPPSGKSILQLDVVKVYVKKLVDNDLRFVKNLLSQNQYVVLKQLESEFGAPLEINIDQKPTTIYIKGKIDRIDSYSGLVRIIDYKSSVKSIDKFTFSGMEILFGDKNYDKQLQLFLYAWLLHKSGYCEADKIIACIIPFKEFSEEPKFIQDAGKNPFRFSAELMAEFEAKLKSFAEEIFNKSVPFTQTKDKKAHEYCPYNAICLL